MIIIKLQGGIGNQLFQYALGRTLETQFGKEVKYDLSFFVNQQKYTPRTFRLDKFNTQLHIASDAEIRAVHYPFGLLSRISTFVRKALNAAFFRRYHIPFEPTFLPSIQKKKSAYLEGYWQSFRYIEPCLKELRAEVTLKDTPSPMVEQMMDEMSKTESVAVHVRRGDYVNTDTQLESLDITYYRRAFSMFAQKVVNPRYYLFTDDIEWVKANFTFTGRDNVVYVSDLHLRDYEELVLMTQCKHIVIANSSFSWWGAALNHYADSIIICPYDWKNTFLKNDQFLCPEWWVRM
jgi:hypothetical protein